MTTKEIIKCNDGMVLISEYVLLEEKLHLNINTKCTQKNQMCHMDYINTLVQIESKKVQYNTSNSTGMPEKTTKSGNWYENTF